MTEKVLLLFATRRTPNYITSLVPANKSDTLSAQLVGKDDRDIVRCCH